MGNIDNSHRYMQSFWKFASTLQCTWICTNGLEEQVYIWCAQPLHMYTSTCTYCQTKMSVAGVQQLSFWNIHSVAVLLDFCFQKMPFIADTLPLAFLAAVGFFMGVLWVPVKTGSSGALWCAVSIDASSARVYWISLNLSNSVLPRYSSWFMSCFVKKTHVQIVLSTHRYLQISSTIACQLKGTKVDVSGASSQADCNKHLNQLYQDHSDVLVLTKSLKYILGLYLWHPWWRKNDCLDALVKLCLDRLENIGLVHGLTHVGCTCGAAWYKVDANLAQNC